ncbi:MAG: aspartate aminotransferase family protein, partial [Halieaceae bacterium]|nr:aspartate aminotransferase family protein [Halieaceae bacterium]
IEVTVPATGLVTAALEQGVVINVTAGNTIRLLPPLVMTDEEASQLGHTVAEIINQAPEIAA